MIYTITRLYFVSIIIVMANEQSSSNQNWQPENIIQNGAIKMTSFTPSIWPIPQNTDFNGTITITTTSDIGDYFRAQLYAYAGKYEQRIGFIEQVTAQWKLSTARKNTTLQLYFKSQFSKFDKMPFYKWSLAFCSARFETQRNCQHVPEIGYWRGDFILRYPTQEQAQNKQQIKTVQQKQEVQHVVE